MMFIYRKEERFDPKTGKLVGKFKVYGDPSFMPEFSVDVNYGCLDACFGSDEEEFRFGEEYSVGMGNFLSAPFTSHNPWSEDESRLGLVACDQVLMKVTL